MGLSLLATGGYAPDPRLLCWVSSLICHPEERQRRRIPPPAPQGLQPLRGGRPMVGPTAGGGNRRRDEHCSSAATLAALVSSLLSRRRRDARRVSLRASANTGVAIRQSRRVAVQRACPAVGGTHAGWDSLKPSPRTGNSGFVLPVAEEAKPGFPQRSKTARKSASPQQFSGTARWTGEPLAVDEVPAKRQFSAITFTAL